MNDYRPLISLGQGIYTVPETCRILQPSMTPRKVHYWLSTDLLGEPLRRGGQGVPTLLSFDQVLKVRTLQRLRDELRFSLQAVRRGLRMLLEELVAEDWHELSFFRTGGGEIAVVTSTDETIALPSAQGVMDVVLSDLDAFLAAMREQWEARAIDIAGYPHLVSDAAVLAGSPVIRGTRIETAFVANLTEELTNADVRRLFPHVGAEAIDEAVAFEGASAA